MALTRLGLNQAINLATNVTGTLPTGNGGTGATSFAPGKVLQAVGGTFTTDTSTSSTSYTDSNFNVSITPSATSSKLLVNFSIANAYVNSGNYNMKLALYSEIGGGSASKIIDFAQVRYNVWTGAGGLSYLYSPNTTSAVVLSIYFSKHSGGSGTVYFHNANESATDSMTVMEIGA